MNIFTYIREEIQVIKERDPAIKTSLEVFLYPSFHAILRYRLAHWFYQHKRYFIARWISQRAVRKTGIEIHPGAVIGKGLFIDHGYGVVIGETAIVGDNVTIYQGVTLGGTGKEHGKRHPTIGNNVMISAGAKVLGSFRVGDDAKIGAGSVVLREVPSYATVVGIPGRVVKGVGVHKHPQDQLDQTHLPDPVRREICRLTLRILELEKKIGGIDEKELKRIEEEHCSLCPENDLIRNEVNNENL
ncbi:MAG: serine O-acetyltransferase [Vallitaleaceae bacterium]|nr:serine O-acetyltransferase [Vallitaleaceae bacterium]